MHELVKTVLGQSATELLVSAFAVVLIEANSAVFSQWLSQWPRLSGEGAEGARNAENSFCVVRREREGMCYGNDTGKITCVHQGG